MIQSLIWAALGTGFAFLMTVSGAATVFLFRKQVNEGLQKIFLGFASGIMIAASIWSLIIPAIEQAEASGGLAVGSGRPRLPFRRPVSFDSGWHFCKMYKSGESGQFTGICSDTP